MRFGEQRREMVSCMSLFCIPVPQFCCIQWPEHVRACQQMVALAGYVQTERCRCGGIRSGRLA